MNDGLWHSVSLSTQGLQVTMSLDNEPASTIELGEHLEAGYSFYFGGQITHSNTLQPQNISLSYLLLSLLQGDVSSGTVHCLVVLL